MRGRSPRFTRPTRTVCLALSLCVAAAFLAAVVPSAGGRLLAGAAARTGKVQRDWTKHPAIVQRNTKADIFAVGDVHGDYDRLVTLLVAAKVIAGPPKHPKEVRWRASDAVLVCTGDLIDKGKHSLKVIALFRALEKQADDAGGQVIVLMGNHEAEFLADPDDDDKALHFLKELHRHDIDPKQVAAGKDPQGIGQYKKLWLVEQWFRACKSLVETRPIYQRDETIRGHVFCSFLALVLRHELQARLEARGHELEWAEVIGDLDEAHPHLLTRDVGVDACEYRPVSFEELRAYMAPRVEAFRRRKAGLSQGGDGAVV
jgi:hypothetical protein